MTSFKYSFSSGKCGFQSQLSAKVKLEILYFGGCHSVTDLMEIGYILCVLKFILLMSKGLQALLCIVTSDHSKTHIRSHHSSENLSVSPNAQRNGSSQ